LLIDWVFLGAFYGFVSFALCLTYVKGLDRRQCYAILTALVIVQFAVRIFSRDVLPGFAARSGDEAFWVQEMARFQLQGTFSSHAGVEGPGVYYLVPLVHSVFHVSYADSLIGIGTFVGILSVLSVFLFYSQGGEYREALAAAILVSFADAIVYSTTVVRPLLFTLTLVPIALYAADLDRDGDIDLAVLHNEPGTSHAVILKNDGHGAFTTFATYAPATLGEDISGADLNGDGYPDLVLTDGWGSGNNVKVMFNNGDGSFSGPVTYSAGAGASACAGGCAVPPSPKTLDSVSATVPATTAMPAKTRVIKL
jgi:hypothetical protein